MYSTGRSLRARVAISTSVNPLISGITMSVTNRSMASGPVMQASASRADATAVTSQPKRSSMRRVARRVASSSSATNTRRASSCVGGGSTTTTGARARLGSVGGGRLCSLARYRALSAAARSMSGDPIPSLIADTPTSSLVRPRGNAESSKLSFTSLAYRRACSSGQSGRIVRNRAPV